MGQTTNQGHRRASKRIAGCIYDPTERRTEDLPNPTILRRHSDRTGQKGDQQGPGTRERHANSMPNRYGMENRGANPPSNLRFHSSPSLGHDDIYDMNAATPTLLLLAVLASCSQDGDSQDASAAFTAFQTALQQQDREACRKLLTVESQPALDSMPWDVIAESKPLKVLGATRQSRYSHLFRIDVADPNNDDAHGQFIVVREYGQMVVDLVASAGLTAKVVTSSGSQEQFEPVPLTPRDHDRIREYQLSQPPR